MPKGEKTGLGRALVKHHNQMIQQSKEKGKYYRSQQKKVLESVTEVSDIEAVIEQADEAHRLFSALNPPANLPINLDSVSGTSEMTAEDRREQQKKEEALHSSSLRIPRRPPWNSKMSVEELDDNERRAFLVWRRNLASLEQNENLVLTPFEKNLDIWRQLWRVLERSDLLVMVVDARDPLFYRCPDLEAYAQEIDEHKKTLLLVNKADLLPYSVREKWAEYFHQHGILFVFWSAKAATAALEGKKLNLPHAQSSQDASMAADTKIYGRDELLAHLQSKAEEIVLMKGNESTHGASDDESASIRDRGVVVGFVGYPNVGKSSTINALVGEKRTGVTSTPGKTKHFQTLVISENLTLCDCPGLVFPSFTSSRYEMVASGVLPIDRMTEHREASKTDIIKIVHICEATLTKRLIEFENTESGGLTIEEFTMKAEELEKEDGLNKSLSAMASEVRELLCEHKGSGKLPFAHGLCQSCYQDFIELSGGLDCGSEPPAFQRAEREREMAKETAERDANLELLVFPGPTENNKKLFKSEEQKNAGSKSDDEIHQSTGSHSIGANSQQEAKADANNATSEESESLSDIDDVEVDIYLHNEEEKKLKKIIWEEMNKEYLEEQAAKEALALTAKKAHEANLTNCSEDVQAAQKLAAAAAAAVVKSRKERQRKRAEDLKISGPAQTAAEATKQVLDRKRLSSKIRYDVLEKLFEDEEKSENTKKCKVMEGEFDDKYSKEHIDAYSVEQEEFNHDHFYDF